LSTPALRRPALLAGAAVVAAGLSSWAAFTVPFSAGAEALCAIALSIGGGAVALRWRSTTVPSPATFARAWWPWLLLGAVAVAWELVCLFLGPRVDHPTVSSLYDAASAHGGAVRGLAFFAWLWLGAALFGR
jgi:hypothetical protein